MKAICIVATLLLSSALAPGMSFWAALAQIESGANDYAVGNVGEISRYQIRPEVWRTYSSSKHYEDPALALSIARKYMSKLQRDFERMTGRAPTEADRVILWKSGITGYEKRGFLAERMSLAHLDRIRRFRNLRSEDELLTRAPAITSPSPPTLENASGSLETPEMKMFFDGSVGSVPEDLSFFGKAVTVSERNQDGGLFARINITLACSDPFYASKFSDKKLFAGQIKKFSEKESENAR